MTIYGLAGLVGVVVFTSSLVVLHLVRPDIDWTRHYVSDFANGRLGWVFIFGAAVHGLGNGALSIGLRRSLEPRLLSTGAVLLFAAAAAGITAAALFPTDPVGSTATITGLVHRAVAAASFPLEFIALFMFSAAFGASSRWRRYTRASFALSATAAVAVVGLFLAVFRDRLPGLAERVALAIFLVWEFGAALELTRTFEPHSTRKAQH